MEDNITLLLWTPSITNGPYLSLSHSFSFFCPALSSSSAGARSAGHRPGSIAGELRRRGLRRARASAGNERALGPGEWARALPPPLPSRGRLCSSSAAASSSTRARERGDGKEKRERSRSVPQNSTDEADPYLVSIFLLEPLCSDSSPSKQSRSRISPTKHTVTLGHRPPRPTLQPARYKSYRGSNGDRHWHLHFIWRLSTLEVICRLRQKPYMC
jgi:hypothetical protein